MKKYTFTFDWLRNRGSLMEWVYSSHSVIAENREEAEDILVQGIKRLNNTAGVKNIYLLREEELTTVEKENLNKQQKLETTKTFHLTEDELRGVLVKYGISFMIANSVINHLQQGNNNESK